MEDERKTADGRRRWQVWSDQEARAALEELSRSGVSVAKFAQARGVSVQRIFTGGIDLLKPKGRR